MCVCVCVTALLRRRCYTHRRYRGVWERIARKRSYRGGGGRGSPCIKEEKQIQPLGKSKLLIHAKRHPVR